MLFLNPWLLLGLLGVVIPVLIHLFSRKSADNTEWGAMQFLADSMALRTKRIQLEDALLMAARCLIFGMIALALARPFSPPGSTIPYTIVLPALLLAICLFAVAAALWDNRPARAWLLLASATTLLLTGAAIFYENYLNLRRFGGASYQDIALIIDASSSMTIQTDGAAQSNFERALDEARDIILKSNPSSAFAIITAGTTPESHNQTPISDRTKLNEIIDTLVPSDGHMDAQAAILAATRTLESGQNEAKQIIVLSDAQRAGWQTEDSAGWHFVADARGSLPNKPQLLLRRLPIRLNFRNLAITDIQFSRDVIGVDREVSIDVTLENTGTEAVTPNSVQLRIGKRTQTNSSLGQLTPGLRTTLTFKHHFKRPGAHVVTASADLQDDLDADNTFTTAVPIIDRLEVMIVEGNPSPEFFDRASAFVELALAPGMLSRQAYLIAPTIVPAPQILSVQSFDTYKAVILADVPRLPASVAAELAEYVERGGGLLIIPGERALPEFYNRWNTSPAKLEKLITGEASPNLQSFNHQALRKIAEPSSSDLGSVILTSYWQLTPRDKLSTIAAELNTGTPFVVARAQGNGKVIMTCSALDNRASNIASRDSFLPFLHELIYHLSNPDTLKLALPPGSPLSLNIAPPTTTPEEQVLDTFNATDPLGQRREAQIVSNSQGTIAKVNGPTIAGLYEIEIPDTAREPFEKNLTPAGTLPFTVARLPEESQLSPLTRADLARINRHIEVLEPVSTKEVHTILTGRSYGQELWKYLAIGVLILLILELLLTRWIATNRKTGSQEVVEFSL